MKLVLALLLAQTLLARETLVSVQAFGNSDKEDQCTLIISAQGIGTEWGTTAGMYVKVGVWNQAMANTLRKDDVGIQCEIVYNDVAPVFKDILKDDFKSEDANVEC